MQCEPVFEVDADLSSQPFSAILLAKTLLTPEHCYVLDSNLGMLFKRTYTHTHTHKYARILAYSSTHTNTRTQHTHAHTYTHTHYKLASHSYINLHISQHTEFAPSTLLSHQSTSLLLTLFSFSEVFTWYGRKSSGRVRKVNNKRKKKKKRKREKNSLISIVILLFFLE